MKMAEPFSLEKVLPIVSPKFCANIKTFFPGSSDIRDGALIATPLNFLEQESNPSCKKTINRSV